MRDKNLTIGLCATWAVLMVMFIAFCISDIYGQVAPWLIKVLDRAWWLIFLFIITGIAFYSLDLVKEKWQL